MADTEAKTLQKVERRGRDLKGIWKWFLRLLLSALCSFTSMARVSEHQVNSITSDCTYSSHLS